MCEDHKDFVHLHLHTEYSLLDGFARIDQVIDYAKQLGMPALGITDHGTMFGVIDFYKACKSADLKPIIGVEAYLAPRGMTQRDSQLDSKPYHMLLIAQNPTGYKNLLKLSSEAQLKGYYYRPRIDKELMAAHAEGIIATSGCLAAEIPRMVEQGKEEEAKQLIGWYQDVFGKENFFLELQAHDIPELTKLNRWLVENAGYANVPLLATNDVHYVRQEDFIPHDTLLCIQTGNTINDRNRLKMTDNSYYLRTQAEMWALFGDYPEALCNSLLIAERCQDLELTRQEYHLPVFPVPSGFEDAAHYLRHLCEKGAYWRFEGNPDQRVWDRLNHELSVIGKMGFATYFLIVWDLTQFASRADIWWNVRGSGAGSLVAYTLGITSLDPIENGLLFERFLNPGRVSMPDMDLDFPEDRRSEMIDYCCRKYGEDKVAAIITFGTLGAKAAIRDVARVHGVSLTKVDQIARTIPTNPALPPISALLGDDPEKSLPELKQVYNNDPEAKKIIDLAMAVEGVPRHASTHAAGVIVADRPLVEYLPLHRPTKGDAEDSPVKMVTQFPMETAESIGLLKIDFLGLSTLTILRKACDLIEQNYGIVFDMSNIPYKPDPDNPEITHMVEQMFEMIGEGHTIGVFQVESSGMRQMLTEMKPKTFEHIIAAISLYRPGPMDYIPTFNKRMHGEEDIHYHHPKLIPILSNTYGICISGDALIFDALTGKRLRVDEVGQHGGELYIQGVDECYAPAMGRVTHLIHSGQKEVFELTLKNGASIKATADHQFLTEAGWQRLGDLHPGAYIGTPPFLIEPEQALNIERGKLRVLAYLIADGSLSNGTAIDFVNKEQVLLDEYVACLDAFENLEPSFLTQIRDVTRVSVRNRGGKGTTSLLAWLRELGLKNPPEMRLKGGCRSHEKFIPPFIFQLNNADLAFFLASLWDCDGFMNDRLCHYKTIAPQLAQDIQTLLLRFGIPSVIHKVDYSNRVRDNRTAYQVTTYDTARLTEVLAPHMISVKNGITGNGISHPTIDRERFIAEVEAATPLSKTAIMKRFGIDRQHFYAKARQRPRIAAHVVRQLAYELQLTHTLTVSNVIWEEIKSIEAVGVEAVYDLTVEGTHNFITNNIIVHNCVYQEQIMQIGAEMFGYSLGEADTMRRAVSKKKEKDLMQHRQIFIERGPENGVDEEAANKIFDDIAFFARYGFNKCVVGNTEIIDAETGRLYQVEDIARNEVQLRSTLSLDTETLRIKPGQISAVLNNGLKPVYRLMTQLGRKIEATANHPFFTFNGWRLLGELKIGDRLAVPRLIPIEGKQVWQDHEVIVLGHLLAEGNLCHPHGLYYYTSDEEQWHDYVTNLEKFPNTLATTHRRRSKMYDVYSKRREHNQKAGVVEWIEKLGLRNTDSYTKFIPDEIFELSTRQLALLISRLWEGDGSINERGRSLYYATSSQRMAYQLQHLFLRLGIISRVRQVRFSYKEGRIGYQVFVTGNSNLQTFNTLIASHFVRSKRRETLAKMVLALPASSSTKDSIPVEVNGIVRHHKEQSGLHWKDIEEQTGLSMSSFHRQMTGEKGGFTRQLIGQLANYFDSDELRVYADNDVYWDKVVSIEYVGEQPTYDLTIEGTHNFIANDIVVHNSHAADYAVITCQTAFLKCHYPHEYMAALMSVYYDNSDKVSIFIADCRRMGIEVLPPNINWSQADFHIENDATGKHIRFGFGAIKNVGRSTVEYIIQQRGEEPFQDFDDFLKRCNMKDVGKRALESLIKVGAFDCFELNRAHALANLEHIMLFSTEYHKNAAIGQVNMFDMLGKSGNEAGSVFSVMKEVAPTEWDRREQLRWEKELIGLYVSEHPLSRLWAQVQGVINCRTTGDLKEELETIKGTKVKVLGLVTNIRPLTTKKGDPMGILTLEDIQGSIEAVMFPRTWNTYIRRGEDEFKVEQDKIYLFDGKVDVRGNDVQLIIEGVTQDFELATAQEEIPLPTKDDDDRPFDEETGEVVKAAQELVPPPVSFMEAVVSKQVDDPGGRHYDALEEPEEMRAAFEQGRTYTDEALPAEMEETPAPRLRLVPKEVPKPSEDAYPAPQLPHTLMVEIERTYDSAYDRRVLQYVTQRALAHPGRHTLCVVFAAADGTRKSISFPAKPIKINQGILDDLRSINGVVRVQVNPASQ